VAVIQSTATTLGLDGKQLIVRSLLAALGVGVALALFDALGPGTVATKTGGGAGAMSMIGPLSAVALVLVLRRPALGLFAAVVVGSIALHGISGLSHAATDVLWPTATSEDTLLILGFTASMLGMVHVSMAGGGFVDLARRIAGPGGADPEAPARRTRLSAWLLGLAIFFDDYANSIVVGSSIRPLADRTGVSRAKLAYIVDATSASVAGVAIVSTWVGMEVGLLQDRIGFFEGIASAGYGVFLELIPYRFYCLLTVFFAFLIAVSGRDFGPMRASEQRALSQVRQAPRLTWRRGHWLDAMGPVLVVLVSVLAMDTALGWHAADTLLQRFIAGADASGLKVLAIAGGLGAVTAILISVFRRLLSPTDAVAAFGHGIAVTMPVLVILVCAMSIRAVCDQAGTPAYLSAMLGNANGMWLPVAAFGVSAIVAFMTGSSWATMGILLPIVVPLAARDGGPDGIWLLAASAAVLDGSIFGDHCSPISDTTVMSSAASGCPHDEHVLTQLPYAVVVMLCAAVFGYIGACWLHLSPWVALVPAALVLTTVVWLVGRRRVDPVSQKETVSR
jgi:Na+/H+ antiporter NhaC